MSIKSKKPYAVSKRAIGEVFNELRAALHGCYGFTMVMIIHAPQIQAETRIATTSQGIVRMDDLDTLVFASTAYAAEQRAALHVRSAQRGCHEEVAH